MDTDRIERAQQEQHQMSRRALLGKGLVVVTALGTPTALLAACGEEESSSPGTSAETGGPGDLEKVGLAIAAGLDTSPVFAGIDKGFYREVGLDVTPHVYTSGVELVQSIASGEAVFTPLGGAATFSAVLNGLPLKVIGIDHGDATAEFYSTSYLIAGPEAGIGPGEFSKLAGKKVGTPLGTDGEAALRALLAQNEVSQDSVQMINVAPPDMATTLTTGQVDAVIFVEPWPSLVESQVEGAVRVSTTFAPYYAPGIFVTTADTLNSSRDMLVKFLTAISKSQQWARENLTGELIDVNSRHTQIPPEVARKAIENINFDGRMSKLVIERFKENSVPTYVSVGSLKAPVDIDEIFDTSLMKEIQSNHPEFFSDLPEIPSEYQL